MKSFAHCIYISRTIIIYFTLRFVDYDILVGDMLTIVCGGGVLVVMGGGKMWAAALVVGGVTDYSCNVRVGIMLR